MNARRRRVVTAGVLTGMFLAALESTVVGTAMPTVIATLGGLAHYSWVFSGYLLTSTVTVPVWGKLSDLYGRRITYQAGVAVFLLGSVLSGLAGTMGQLIAFRAVQGIGAGALVPLAMTIIGDIYTLEERARMQAVFSSVWGLACVAGPLIGGFVTENLSWRWVFYLNIPFGVVAAGIVGAALEEPPLPAKPIVDWWGAFTLTLGMSLALMLTVGDEALSAIGGPLPVGLATVALLAAFVAIERRAPDPMIPLELLVDRVVGVAVLVGFLIGGAMFVTITFVPLFAQGVQGATATQAGSMLTPLMLSWVSFSIAGGYMLLKLGQRTTVLGGCVGLMAGFVLLSNADVTTTRGVLQLTMVVIGAGLGLTMLTLLIAVQHAVPRERRGVATSLNQFARSVGGAICVAVLGALLSASLGDLHAGGGGDKLGALMDAHRRAALPAADALALRDHLAAGLARVFRATGVMVVLSFFCAFLLPRGLQQAASDHHAPVLD